MTITIVALSDTHNLHQQVTIPDGDILIHAGDFTTNGTLEEVDSFNDFLGTLPHKHKLVIAGNAEKIFESNPQLAQTHITNASYLQDSGVELEGLYFYGSPWQPWFFNGAFNLQRGAEIKAKWDLIPEHTDVLITHGPPYGILDRNIRSQNHGSEELREIVQKIRPKLHIFGHIHASAGQVDNKHTRFYNVSICNVAYVPLNKPAVIQIDVETSVS